MEWIKIRSWLGEELLIFFQSCNSFGQINEINTQMEKANEHTQEQYPGPTQVSGIISDPLQGLGSRPGEHSGLLHFWDGFSNIRALQGHGRLCRGWDVLPPPRLGSEVGNIIPWQPKWMSALLHVLLSLDALGSNHGAWNFSSCLFSLTVVLINIFLRSPQATPGCSWKAKTNSRSGFLLFAIIICEKCNHSFLCSDLCMNTLTNF